MEKRTSLWQAILRGAIFRCPRCGCGNVYQKYLTIQNKCDICDLQFSDYPCEDGPPYFTICLVGFFIVPLILWVDTIWELPIWFTTFVVLPLLIALMLILMPIVKGAYLGVLYYTKYKH